MIRTVEADGWFLVRTRGSQRQFRHPTKRGTVTIAGKLSLDMPPRTLKNVFRQAGLGSE
ncbi:MAG TPA: type II toxin-antitoxin system HicA family toxin [Pseudomonadales bacterium]|nr:type II toxin-antitoxin system HicA family toxin [Pseudomonadales bacterium]